MKGAIMKVKVLTVTLMLLIVAVAVSSQQAVSSLGGIQAVRPPEAVLQAIPSPPVLNFPSNRTESDSKVLVIPGSEALSDEAMGVVVEDMQIMSHIIALKLGEGNLNPPSRRTSASLDYWSQLDRSGGDEIESIYLEGFGAIFLMNTNYSLVAPVEKVAEPVQKPKDALWQEVRQNINNPPTQTRSTFEFDRYASGFPGVGTRDTLMEYSEEAVNKLQGTLLATLVHASNMSRVGDDEVIVIHVTGAPRMVQSPAATEVEPVEEVALGVAAGGVVSGGIPPGAVTVTNVPITSRDARRAPVGKPTHMVIRAPMSVIKDLADEEIDFETFKENVSVVIY